MDLYIARLFGMVWLIIATVLLYMLIRSKTFSKVLLFLSLYFFASGAIVFVGVYIDNKILANIGGILSLAFLSLGLGFYQRYQIKAFSETIKVQFKTYHSYPIYKDRFSYKPVFSYNYKGQSYEEETLSGYSEETALRRFKPGETYEVFINPSRPRHITEQIPEKKKTGPLMVLGLVLIFLYVIFTFT